MVSRRIQHIIPQNEQILWTKFFSVHVCTKSTAVASVQHAAMVFWIVLIKFSFDIYITRCSCLSLSRSQGQRLLGANQQECPELPHR
jgi:hypothetical protein